MNTQIDSIQSRILARVEEAPDRRAISFPDKREGIEWITREEFHQDSRRVHSALTNAGLRPQEVCLIILPSERFCATALMSALQIGAVPLLMAPPFIQAGSRFSSLAAILRGVVEKADPKLIICSDQIRSFIVEDAEFPNERILSEDDCTNGPLAAEAPIFPCGTDRAALQLTSGTTGHPRICVWEQRAVLAALDGMYQAMKLSDDDVCLNWTPLYHDMGLVNNFLLCLASGVPLVMLSPQLFVRKPALWLRKLFECEGTVTWSPNFGFAIAAQRASDEDLKGVRLDAVRAFWNAAERVHLKTMRAFHQRFEPLGLRIEALKTNFGCAENVGGATFSDPDSQFRYERLDSDLLWKHGTARVLDATEAKRGVNVVGVGRPHPGLRVSVVSEGGEELREGQVGEIVLKTPSALSCYLRDEDATAETIRNGDVFTGDLGYVRNGELFWVGRVRERINIRGKKIDPSDFEHVLLNIPGLRKGCFAAFGVNDPQHGSERIVLIAELRSDNVIDEEEIKTRINEESLACLGVGISEIFLVPPRTLAKTSSGKRRHRYFRDLYLDSFLQAESFASYNQKH